MLFSLGILELITIVATLVPTGAVLLTRGYRPARWLIVACVCLITAAVTTPADPASTAMMSVAFFAMIVLGSRMRLLDAAAT